MSEHSEPDELREQHARATLESMSDGVITADEHGRVTLMNAVAERLTGWQRAQAAGVPLSEVLRVTDELARATGEHPAMRALREGLPMPPVNRALLIAKNGIERAIDLDAAPMRGANGESHGVVIVVRDAAERRSNERALRQSEERFRLLVDSVQDYAIFMLDPDGHVVSWNAGAERIKGYRADQIVGRHFSCFYRQEAIDRGWPEEELRLARRDGRLEDEGWRVRQDGTKFWANVVITAVHGESGELKGFAKVTRDLTQRRQLERARAEAETLADLDRKKNEFLAMLSHELRNPLASLENAVHLLRLARPDESAHERATAIVARQVGSLTRLVDDLLDVSRIATGRIQLRYEHVDARVVVERSLETVRPQIDRRRIEVAVELPADPVWLNGDPARLEQVVVNLLTNAIKYNEDRGHVVITLLRDKDEAVLRVRDDGIGISPDLLPRVFSLFTQGERSLDRAQGGLGVGLTIVRRVVEMHRGTVEAHSAGVGQGSEFVVRLPISVLRVPAKVVEPRAPSGRRLVRVLVVDDNRDAADSCALLLQNIGHEVQVAYAGGTALEMAPAFRPDAVLLDIGLPMLDGYEVARRMRLLPEARHARLIAVTGYGQQSDRDRSRDAGFDVHLVKPIDLQQLQELLHT